MLRLAVVSLALAFGSTPVRADEAITRGLAAASLHEGPLEMQAACEPLASGRIEVSASFSPRQVTMMAAPPLHRTLALEDGDAVYLTLPGYPQVLYRFSRSGALVTMSAHAVSALRPVAAGS